MYYVEVRPMQHTCSSAQGRWHSSATVYALDMWRVPHTSLKRSLSAHLCVFDVAVSCCHQIIISPLSCPSLGLLALGLLTDELQLMSYHLGGVCQGRGGERGWGRGGGVRVRRQVRCMGCRCD
jgi:hypothetical protein